MADLTKEEVVALARGIKSGETACYRRCYSFQSPRHGALPRDLASHFR